MRGRRVLDIPVYSCTEAEHASKKDADLWRIYSNWRSHAQSDDIDFHTWKKEFRFSLGGPWRFNEIVAYLYVYFEGHHVKIDAWTRLERNRHNKTRPYRNTHRVAEASFTKATNDGIRAAIHRAIAQAETWTLSRGWHPDYDVSLVEALDWERWLSSRSGTSDS